MIRNYLVIFSTILGINVAAETNTKKFNCEVSVNIETYPNGDHEIRDMLLKIAKKCNGDKVECQLSENNLTSVDIESRSFIEKTFSENSEECLKHALASCHVSRIGVVKSKKVITKFNNKEQDTFVCKEKNIIQNISKNTINTNVDQINDTSREITKEKIEKVSTPLKEIKTNSASK